MAKLYDLTRYTGKRRGEERRVPVMTVETTYRGLAINGIGLVAAVPLVGILMPMLGPAALLSVAFTLGAANLLAQRRRDGLQVSYISAWDDRFGARKGWSLFGGFGRRNNVNIVRKTGVVVLAGQELKPPRIIDLVPNVLDTDTPADEATLTTSDILAGNTEPVSSSSRSEPAVPVHALGYREPQHL